MSSSTITDVLPPAWAADGVFRLREWASERFHPLDLSRKQIVIGAAPTCDIQIDDASGWLSRAHARLKYQHDQWYVTNLSKNGVRLDGVRHDAPSVLLPGVEIGIGGMTLVAESPRMIALRNLFARLIGWDAKQREPIDVALQAVRVRTTRRAITVLCGDGDLTPVAEEIHQWTLPGRPLVLCHPRPSKERGEGSIVRARTGLEAVARAVGGTVCILNEKLPRDLDRMLKELAKPSSNVRLIVCAQSARAAKIFQAQPIELPSLGCRAGELGRVVDEYLVLARRHFKMARLELEPADRTWILRRNSDTFAEIRRATYRLAAIYRGGSIAAGAVLLGITRRALRKWLDARGFDLERWL